MMSLQNSVKRENSPRSSHYPFECGKYFLSNGDSGSQRFSLELQCAVNWLKMISLLVNSLLFYFCILSNWFHRTDFIEMILSKSQLIRRQAFKTVVKCSGHYRIKKQIMRLRFRHRKIAKSGLSSTLFLISRKILVEKIIKSITKSLLRRFAGCLLWEKMFKKIEWNRIHDLSTAEEKDGQSVSWTSSVVWVRRYSWTN